MEMNRVIENILHFNSIAITYHQSPDGDALGSALGLMLGLRKLGKDAYIISRDRVPDIYRFLPSTIEVREDLASPKENTKCLIIVDCGNVERISGNIDISDSRTIINLDHHLSNNEYGDINYVDTSASATGEIIYSLLKGLNVPIDASIAECLYTAIITDTGSFKYPGTTSNTHSIAGDLINTGINFPLIHRRIFENKPLQKLKLYGQLLDKIELFLNDRLAILAINKEQGETLGDNAEIISLQMQIDTIEVGAFLKQVDEGVKVSLRSKEKVDVRKIAESFGGGGHERAAGFLLKDINYIEKAKETIISILEKELI
ncbi:DHH family phosphoesterase [Clostridium amazonitimonense]|uniref:DHH family phosphoesterase n=1 Tax=Clostridium amazonitimonense TaxID=1499689 RepID=UPI00164DFBD3|nr:bifunctional oligoribonuclease/PAP phosphatase NrnA [Clostridium amazonitimonense]